MTGIISLLKLVVQIIKSPIKTIKGTELISYDRDAMLRLFSIVSAVDFILAFSLFYGRLSVGAVLILGVLAPFIMFLLYNIAAVLYYATFKLLGKGIEANYESVKIALYPLFLTLLVINIIFSLVAHVLPIIIIVSRYVMNAWFYIISFFLLRYKLRQSTTRSILISLVPLFIEIILRLISVIIRM